MSRLKNFRLLLFLENAEVNIPHFYKVKDKFFLNTSILFFSFSYKICEGEIKNGKTLFQEAGFKWIMILMTAGVALMLGYKLLYPESGTNWGTLGVLGISVLFYWLVIRKMNN